MGRAYLAGLGVDQVLAASTAPAELLGLLTQVGANRLPKPPGRPAWPTQGPPASRGSRGFLSVWTKACGGVGLTEAVAAAAEHLGRRSRVLLVEADELAPVLVSRLLRSPDGGLAWAASRAGQGLRALPDGLSGPRDDGTAPLGHFDVICGTQGAAGVIAAAHLEKLLAEALGRYEHVVVETSWLVGSPGPASASVQRGQFSRRQIPSWCWPLPTRRGRLAWCTGKPRRWQPASLPRAGPSSAGHARAATSATT